MQQVDDPPSLPVGTEVSAKYKGAFCEAKVRKVVRNIKVKVAYKQGLGSGIVPDDAIKSGVLRVGAVVEVKHPDRRENVEATITKIQDGSQYTVVFDDGDITTLRRTALCLKSGRHFNESETLDQLPLTHPEHFGNPVIGGRRGGRRSRHLHDDSSDEEDEPIRKGKAPANEKEEHIGKVVCVESNETKKKDKDKWFPGLVVAPTAQVTVKIRVKDEYLVRSFKDGRYYTVPKKEAMEFTREMASKQDGPAVQAALEYLDNENNLPPHWDRDALFGLSNSSTDYEGELDSDSSDDEPREEKDHFVAQLYKHMDDRGTPLNKVPSIQNRDVDFYRLFRAVQKLGGYNRVTSQNQWKSITIRLGFTPITVSVTNLVKQAYKKFLQPYEEFHRKLGCSMIMTPRNASRSKGRSLVRANSVASPKPEVKELPQTITTPTTAAISTVTATPAPVSTKITSLAADESENTSESSIDIIKTKRKISVNSNKVKTLIDKYEEKIKDEINVTLQIPAEPSNTKSTTVITKEKLKESKEIQIEEPTVVPPPPPPQLPRIGHVTIPIPPPLAQQQQSSNIQQSQQQGPGPLSVKKERFTKSGRPEEKRGRKKKEIVEPTLVIDKPLEKTNSDTIITVPVDFPVEVGDKLKVYYHEKTVTYEAKVIEISIQKGKPLYLVHYTGWNNRYDEWVPKERIAENLTNNRSSKKSKISQGTQPKSLIDTPTKSTATGPPTSALPPTVIKAMTVSKRGRGRSDSQPPRSTTPSSVASNSSRTKSPATPATQRRITRTQPNQSRRTSNNISDISMQTDSDSDSDAPVIRKQTRSIQQTPSNQHNKGPPTFKTSSNTSPNSETEEDDSAKGRDYDLNQIRSELKGFKELKSPSPEPDTPTSGTTKKSEKIFEYPGKLENKSDLKKLTEKSSLVNRNIESKSSTDLSSDTDSFADDDSQSSDKTTQLENMTEKLQQKIKAEKIAQNKFNSISGGSGVGLKNPSAIDIISPLTAAGVEKIIKDSLAEKRQETLKASKPFLIEKSIFKTSTSTTVPPTPAAITTPSDKHDEKPIVKLEIPIQGNQLTTRKNSIDKKNLPILTEANLKKMPQVSIIEAKIQIPSRNEKKYQSTAIVSANITSNTVSTTINVQSTSAATTTLAITSADSKSQNIIKKDLDTKPSISTLIKNESFNVLSNNKTPISPATSCVSSEKITSTTIHHPMMKITTTKEPLLKSSLTVKSTSIIPTTSSIKNDIYEFKEPEPFEFEARKTSSITTITGNISALSETEKKKKLLQKSSYELPLNHEFKSLAVSTTTAISTQQPVVVVTTTPIKKGKKSSPIKDATEKLVVQSSSATTPSKLNKIDDKSEQIASSSSLLSPPQSTAAIMNTVKSTDTTFDVLRKSPSFNLNINALNEELATTVQETTKALTDVNLPKIPSLNLSVISLPSTSQQKLPQYNPPFIDNKSDISNVFEMKQDTEKSSSDDDEQKTKKRKNRTHGLESVKKILLSDTGGFDLEPRKIEKPSSIADKVLKALNQKKEEEAEKIKEIDSTKISLKTNNDQSPLSVISSSCSPSTSYASINKLNSPNFTISSTSNLITNEPPKIEMPIFIKKDFENALKKPILNSPEHKLDILESIASKNNDLTETIHKLESAILMKTTNVDHFEEDSSDSTDSERRLVIEDDESLEDNNLNDTISAPEYSPLKKSTEPQQQLSTSIICTVSTSAAAVAAANTIASLSTTLTQHQQQLSSIIKCEEKLPISKLTKRSEIISKSEDSIFTLAAVAAASKDNTIGLILPQTKPNLFGLQSTNYNQSLLSDAGVKPILDINQQPFKTTTAAAELKRCTTELQDLPLTTIKKEEILIASTSNEIVQNLHSDSINLLLCEETIPGSPQPVTAKDIMENALSKIHLHPTESDIKPIPMDIECVGPMISSSIASGSNTTAAASAAAVSAVAAAAKLKVEQQTSSSSPHDSQSQDDSSEDLKKQLDQDIEDDGDVSPKKRRRTRKHSEVECHMKRRRGNRGMEINVKKNNGSDSDDNSDANISQRSTASARPIRPCQYNFLVQLDSALNPNQRISILRKKITELRKTYNMIKTELASIDRRRKKLRRREREKKQQQKQQLNV